MRFKNLIFIATVALASEAFSKPANPVKACKTNEDCVLVDNPKCKDEYNKMAVNQASAKKIAKRKCKKTTYKFMDSDAGASMSAECAKNACTIQYNKN